MAANLATSFAAMQFIRFICTQSEQHFYEATVASASPGSRHRRTSFSSDKPWMLVQSAGDLVAKCDDIKTIKIRTFAVTCTCVQIIQCNVHQHPVRPFYPCGSPADTQQSNLLCDLRLMAPQCVNSFLKYVKSIKVCAIKIDH